MKIWQRRLRVVSRVVIDDRSGLHRFAAVSYPPQVRKFRASLYPSHPAACSTESRRRPRRYGFIDVFLLRGVHAHQRFDCFDDPLGVANEIAVDLLRR